MIGPFCGIDVMTNEEYRKVVKRKRWRSAAVFFAGLLNCLGILLAERLWDLTLNSQISSFYLGIGTGLVLVGIVLWFRYSSMLRDEEKLKESRVELSDERNKKISNSAFRTATITVIIALYITVLAAGIWHPIVLKILAGAVTLFTLVYIVAYQIQGRYS